MPEMVTTQATPLKARARVSGADRFTFGSIIAILCLLLCASGFAQAQSLALVDIDVSSYPLIRARFFAFDADGMAVDGLSQGDMLLHENTVPRTVTTLSCPSPLPPYPISSVLTIDISGSMSGERLEIAKAAARAWIYALPLGLSECAITTFNSVSFLNQDFSTSRSLLLSAVDALRAKGGSNYEAALLSPPAGALRVSSTGRSKRVIVFLSDGSPRDLTGLNDIVAEAQRQKASIYAVMLGMSAPQALRDICALTGGLCFDNINAVDEAERVYRLILRSAQGGSPCSIEWVSEGCSVRRNLDLLIPSISARLQLRYDVPQSVLPHLGYTPSHLLRFGQLPPGSAAQQYVTLSAAGGPVSIDRIEVSNPLYRVIDHGGGAPPFKLAKGQHRTLTLEYRPVDSTYSFCRLDVASDACLGTPIFADGGWVEKQPSTPAIRVLRPNGGEQLVVGSSENLLWDGVMPEECVRLEYSTDAGVHWRSIARWAEGLGFTWGTVNTPSDSCLLRVTAYNAPEFIADMVLIPAGSFRMGNMSHIGAAVQYPVHDVVFTRPFWMGRTEVTQEQYEAVTGANPSRVRNPTRPVEAVNWFDAVEFCNKLSRMEGLDTCYSGRGSDLSCDFSANGYRLPTEAEWEYACRAGTETDFYTGNMTSPYSPDFDPVLDRAGWYGLNSGRTTHPVGWKEANAFGLYDTHGNVFEWCWDWFGESYYSVSPREDPRGPSTGTWRVLRGGSCQMLNGECISAFRKALYPDNRYGFHGFRLARSY